MIQYENRKIKYLLERRRNGKVLVFGHRGARGLAPENTLSGFERAMELGVDGVELDVMSCATGEPVVFHDYWLNVLAASPGWVEKTSLDALKKLDVGAMFDAKYRGERIPTLEEVLDLTGDRIIVNIELKGEYAGSEGLEEAVVKIVREMKLDGSVILSSFNPMRVARVREIAPELVTGMIIQQDVAGWIRRFWFTPVRGADALHPEIGMVTEPLTRKWHQKGRAVIAWPANTIDDMRWLMRCGVDGIITDRPDILLKEIEGDGRNSRHHV